MLELIGVDGLTQWDVGRQVKVDKDIDMVHFSNRPYGYSKNVKVTNGVADVPDMFLTSCAPLRVWAYVGDFEKGYTKIEKIYEVKPKNRPEDYIYTPEDVKTWEKLQSEIGDLSNLETKAKDNLVSAVNEAAKSGKNDYEKLTNLPSINGVELMGNKTGEELGLVPDLSGYATKDEIPVIPEALPNPSALTFTGAVNAVYDGSSAVSVEIPSGGTDISLGLTSASVGQIIKVKAVDESGKPTEWEAAEMAGGGVDKNLRWAQVLEMTTTEQMNIITADKDPEGRTFASYNAIAMLTVLSIPADSTQTSANGIVWVTAQPIGYNSRASFNIANWKTSSRTISQCHLGTVGGLVWCGSTNSGSMTSANRIDNIFTVVKIEVHNADDHLPIGTTVRVFLLSEENA